MQLCTRVHNCICVLLYVGYKYVMYVFRYVCMNVLTNSSSKLEHNRKWNSSREMKIKIVIHEILIVILHLKLGRWLLFSVEAIFFRMPILGGGFVPSNMLSLVWRNSIFLEHCNCTHLVPIW